MAPSKPVIAALLCAASWMSAAGAADAELMTAQEAFQQLGVPYVPFDVRQAAMPEEEKGFLAQFFELIEQAVIERVQTMQVLSSSADADVHVNEFQAIEQRIRGLQVPSRLQDVHALVLSAIGEERMAIEQWRMRMQAGQSVDIRTDPLVQSSSAKLHQAYQTLMGLYPAESRNREAMERHLCALDFL